MSDPVSAHACVLEREKRNDDALRRPRLCIGRRAALSGPDWTYRHLGARIAGKAAPSRPVPVWLYVPVRQSQSYCYIYRIQTIGVAHASTTTASSPSVRALALALAARRRSRMDQNNSNRQQQAPPPPPAGQIDRSIVISE